MVPPDWKHPMSECRGRGGDYKPLHDGSYAKEARAWLDNARAWDDGTHPDAAKNKAEARYWWEWDGPPPEPEEYMPDWPQEQRTHLQMYENTTEGTPISPVFATPEELARWLADNGASSFGKMTATYEQWLSTIGRGYAPSAMSVDGGPLVSGVEGLATPSGSAATATNAGSKAE